MCTLEERGNLFLLILTGDNEHRLGPTLVDSIRSALAQVKSQATPGSALITTAHDKFFSNGLDLPWAQAAGSSGFRDRLNHLVNNFKPIIADLLSLPMPTIAAVSGHAAAAGFRLAISHDYVLMKNDRSVLYMSELDIGLTFADYFMAMLKSKISDPAARRDVMLRAKKVKAEEAVRMGIVDSTHDSAESTVEAAVRLAEQLSGRKWNGEVYAEIRKAMHPEVCGLLGLSHRAVVAPWL
uniref:Delta(3)-Delta(2)-enoyl-CoA isomerase n=1 Tax=Vitis vinifera TaxID=29760 RepID=A5B6A9_VITVI|nr:hypothetical protein VITISV_036844 [Vitis vinifera]